LTRSSACSTRVSKAADGYPPYNIERIVRNNGQPDRLADHASRLRASCEITRRDQSRRTAPHPWSPAGRQNRQFLHRGIAARQFQRTFVLADGIEVLCADLKNGLLSIDLAGRSLNES